MAILLTNQQHISETSNIVKADKQMGSFPTLTQIDFVFLHSDKYCSRIQNEMEVT